MALMDESAWRGKVSSGGWAVAAGGDAAVIEPATGAAFTDLRWVTVRGDAAGYPF